MMYTIELLDTGGAVLDRANMEAPLGLVIDRAKGIFAMRGDLTQLSAVRIIENGGAEVFRWLGEG